MSTGRVIWTLVIYCGVAVLFGRLARELWSASAFDMLAFSVVGLLIAVVVDIVCSRWIGKMLVRIRNTGR